MHHHPKVGRPQVGPVVGGITPYDGDDLEELASLLRGVMVRADQGHAPLARPVDVEGARTTLWPTCAALLDP